MKKYTFIFAFLLATLTAAAQTEIYWNRDTIEAPSLKNNMLGDKTQQEIIVSLPSGYNDSDIRYPVVYFLWGYDREEGEVVELKTKILEVKNNNQLKDMIIVMIHGNNRLRGSFYVNSPVTGNWEDYITNDVVTYIDNKYRTLAKPESRSITGHSMGGYGALNLSMLHPDIYCAGFGISPGLYSNKGFDNSQIVKDKDNIKNTISLIKRLNSLPEDIAQKEYLNFINTCKDYTIIFTLAYGSAFAPNTERPPYINFPFDIINNDTITDKKTWDLWQNGFGGVEKEIEMYKGNLQKLKIYGISCGYNDWYKWILDGSIYYSDKLTENNISHVLLLDQGTHSSSFTSTFTNIVLPMLSNAMVH